VMDVHWVINERVREREEREREREK
jgi:hypothetical protein